MENENVSIAEQIRNALDGRKQRWLSFEIRIAEQELSRKMKGAVPFKEEELKKIEDRLGFKIIRDTGASKKQNNKKSLV